MDGPAAVEGPAAVNGPSMVGAVGEHAAEEDETAPGAEMSNLNSADDAPAVTEGADGSDGSPLTVDAGSTTDVPLSLGAEDNLGAEALGIGANSPTCSALTAAPSGGKDKATEERPKVSASNCAKRPSRGSESKENVG